MQRTLQRQRAKGGGEMEREQGHKREERGSKGVETKGRENTSNSIHTASPLQGMRRGELGKRYVHELFV